ncbi:MAG: FMN-binding protein, partial [Phocaeicola sp.]
MKIGIQLLQLLTCVLFLTVIAINKEQKVFNKEVSTFFVDQPKELDTWVTDDGLTAITTQRIGKEVFGYAGNIPLNLYLKGDKIERIELLKNAETPSFLKRATKSGLLESWNGLTLSQAQEKKIDAVSGATLSSSAIIESVNIAAQFGTDNSLVKGRSFDWGDVRFWAVLIVVLIGMILPLYYKNKYYRIIQLTLNVAVLGFWSGSFISLSLLVNILANGVNFWLFIIPFLLIVTAFIYPLFGKKNH